MCFDNGERVLLTLGCQMDLRGLYTAGNAPSTPAANITSEGPLKGFSLNRLIIHGLRAASLVYFQMLFTRAAVFARL